MPAWGWGGLGVLYLVLLVTLGIVTFRKRHYVLFAFGFLLPFLWLVGAAIKPRA